MHIVALVQEVQYHGLDNSEQYAPPTAARQGSANLHTAWRGTVLIFKAFQDRPRAPYHIFRFGNIWILNIQAEPMKPLRIPDVRQIA